MRMGKPVAGARVQGMVVYFERCFLAASLLERHDAGDCSYLE